MFSIFFMSTQQDWKLMIIAPLVCAIFRLAFIYVYAPNKAFSSCKKKWIECFRYGFWWGMDYNAYVFLISWILISIPSAFFPAYCAISDSLRVGAITLYCLVLYVAFMGKMIFYYHFQDIYNPTMRLGKNADKKNFLDIFFNQNYGAFILLGIIPYTAAIIGMAHAILATPIMMYPAFSNGFTQYGFNTIFCIAMILFFYYFRYGGHISHRKKPEWDTVPDIVKKDMFFAKACIDDLIAIEMVYKTPVQTILSHDDKKSIAIISTHFDFTGNNPIWDSFARTASGPKIEPPKHIFLIVGESYTQAPFDKTFAALHLVDRGKQFRNNSHTMSIQNFLPAGMVSQPAITSLLAGIFDDNLEINEKRPFWESQTITSLPRQLKRLGYRTALWYGGSLSWASLGLFGKAMGFDAVYGGPDICPPNSPSTWLGVYDHIFLNSTYENILDMDDGKPIFHFVYTTSNHGPYTIPFQSYGFDPSPITAELPEDMKHDKTLLADLGTYWYTDQALSIFVEKIQKQFPTSLIMVTGDHSRKIIPFRSSLYPNMESSIREKYCTSFAMYHPDFSKDLFSQLQIGGHMNIMPTIIESVAPKGFTYYSMVPSFYESISHVVTPYHWMDTTTIGYYSDSISQSLHCRDAKVCRDDVQFADERDAYCEVTGWIVRHADTCLT